MQSTRVSVLRSLLVVGLAAALLLGADLGRPALAAAPPCGGTAASTCDGACPLGTSCFDIGGSCACVPSGMGCGAVAGTPLCYGECPPGTACIDTGGSCACAAAPPCGGSAAPACDGACPLTDSCEEVSPGICSCVARGIPCGGLGGPPVCLGECPPTEACFDISGTCTCSMSATTTTTTASTTTTTVPTVPTVSGAGAALLGLLLSLAMLGDLVRRRVPVHSGVSRGRRTTE